MFVTEHPSRTLHLLAEYPDNVNFKMEIYRTGDFPRVSETSIAARLKSSRQLYTKIQWRPEAILDFVVSVMHKIIVNDFIILLDSTFWLELLEECVLFWE